MNKEDLKQLLVNVQNGNVSIDKALKELKTLPFKNLGHTVLDNHRELRNGSPEVIYCQGKTIDQVLSIIKSMLEAGSNILATRADHELYEACKVLFPKANYHEQARIITLKSNEYEITKTYISVITAGTSDIPVAEEAAVTAEFYGNCVKKLFDIGVAGIHRIFENLEIINNAKVNIVVAGMEGALPSVIGGLVDKPVIAVPTSIGYGANFNGLAALLAMLNSCASGIGVVNIDNGFGAGYLANMINKL